MNTRDLPSNAQNIIADQGWTDKTVGELALNYILPRHQNGFTNYLQQVANEENEQQERQELTDRFWKEIEENSSQALGEAVLYLLEHMPIELLKTTVKDFCN